MVSRRELRALRIHISSIINGSTYFKLKIGTFLNLSFFYHENV